MNELAPLFKLFQQIGAPSGTLILALIGVIVWMGKQYLKLRAELDSLNTNRGQRRREAIQDAWTQINALKAQGLTPEEFEQAKSQILATVQLSLPSPKGKNEEGAQRGPSTVDFNKAFPEGTQRVSQFFGALVQFGFFGVWGLGWGFGMGMFFVPVVYYVAKSVYSILANGELLKGLLYIILLLLVLLAGIGLVVVPAVVALWQAALGLLKFINLIVRSSKLSAFLVCMEDLGNSVQRVTKRAT